VLIVMLIGFTVRLKTPSLARRHHGIVSISTPRAGADRLRDLIWDWDVSADKVFTSPETETTAGPARRRARRTGPKWLVCTAGSGPISRGARQRARPTPRPPGAGLPPAHADGHFMWFALKARPVVGPTANSRVVGTLTDVTEIKERRRAHAARFRARQPHRPPEPQTVPGPPRRGRQFSRACGLRPTLMVIDLDRFIRSRFRRHRGRRFDPL